MERDNERNQKVLELKLLGEEKNQEEINEELTKLKIDQLTKEIELENNAGRDAIDKELELAKLKGQIRIDQEKRPPTQFEKFKTLRQTRCLMHSKLIWTNKLMN